ncbi:TrmH family RNA methyltransferase [Glycomyces harbinensis]|uniref:RNA methyltransferase, TrmH family n=1 Tax=Glycomyces harbinensis TaxID=58114 RepID=A0A1G6TPV8_9ACTN|nr:TrmH family RNA methyltransferase [Glycomyces harbinensis]SDD30365.1 RNA methyltransferase, TrmH family [Glycomyces harbinensis]
MSRTLQVSVRNARFQQWETLLRNRNKRHRAGSFLVQGVRPISLAVEHGWTIEALLYDADRARLSDWARGLLERPHIEQAAVSGALLAELGEKEEDNPPELLAQVAMRQPRLADLETGPSWLGLVVDRPTSPGNLGTLIRSADAFGADAVVVTGRNAADPYDPKAVRASTGSLFAVPVVNAASAQEVAEWARSRPEQPIIVGTDERGELPLSDHDLGGPALIVVGNETTGMSNAWFELVDATARIPMSPKAASSLNAANAGSVALYEATCQRTGGDAAQ